MQYRTVSSVQTPAAYLGGKRLLAERIISIIDQVDHHCYIEPFMGMGGVFFRRTRIPPAEVINDISNEIINFFRVIQRHFPEFQRILRWVINSRGYFQQFDAIPASSLTDVERAARFYFLQRNRFGGKPGSHTFSIGREGSRFDIRKLKARLDAIHARLSGVTVENLPYSEVFAQYDAPQVLFYCDPPYFEGEGDYGTGIFSREDFDCLAQVMREMKGKCILSINDRPETREIFSGLEQLQVKTHYSINRSEHKEVGELIVCNFKPAVAQGSFAW